MPKEKTISRPSWHGIPFKPTREGGYTLIKTKINGRQVRIGALRIDSLVGCENCSGDGEVNHFAAYIVIEANGEYWFYCGVCDPGG